MPATFSIYNLLVDRFLSFTPGPTAGWVLSINSDGTTNWVPQSSTTITNPGANRVLISDGSTTASVAQPALTFNGTTLQIGTNSTAVSINTNITNLNGIIFNQNPTISATSSFLFYDKSEESLAYYMDGQFSSPVHLGRETVFRAYNSTGATISKGLAVYVNGYTGSIPTVALANAASDISAVVDGVANDDVPNNQIGLFIMSGIISGVNTNAIVGTTSVNSYLYLSDTTPGYYTYDYFNLNYTSRVSHVGQIAIGSTSSNGKIFVTIGNENINLSITDRQRNILEGNALSTGAFYVASPGLTISSSTTFNVPAVKAWIVDNSGITSSVRPTAQFVQYNGTVSTTTPYLTTDSETFVLITGSSSLLLQNTFPTPQQRRQNIYIGKVIHPNKSTLQNTNNLVDYEQSPMSAVRDIWTPISLINQGVIPSANAVGSLAFKISAGTLWGNGIGFVTNTLNPNSVSILGQTPVTFQYRTQTGGSFSNVSVIDPANYDNGGVVTSVGGGSNAATNQRIYLFPTGVVRVQYGQTVYSNLAAAVSAQQTEQFVIYSNNRNNGILIGVLSVSKSATDLTDSTQAVFNYVSKFGEPSAGSGAYSTTTLQQAYNNSSSPEIITSIANNGLTIRRGSSSDNDNILEGQNGSGITTFYVTGLGNTYLNRLQIAGLTGSTLSLYIDAQGNVGATTAATNGAQGAQGPMGGTGAGGALGYYGAFYSTQSQTNLVGNTALKMPLDFTYESNGVSLYSNTGIRFNYPGTFNIQFSTVFTKTNSSNGIIDIWFSVNGDYLTASNTEFNIAGQSDQVVSWNFLKTFNQNDYFEIYWSSPSTDIAIKSIGTQSGPTRPSVPSVIVTAQQVMYTQFGPTGSQGFQGRQGLTGPQGFQGFQGLTGPQGFQGFQGLTGPQGFQGLTGSQGFQGFQGATGPGFNSISNPGDFRILTATGSSTNSAIAQPSLTFNPNTGQLGVSGSVYISSTISGATLLTVEGSSGQLFSIVDSLTGSLFSVNDISGMPILEVFSDNTTLIGDYQTPALYTTKKVTLVTGSNTIYAIATASYTGAFVDYHLLGTTNSRSGSINAAWLGNTIRYYELGGIDIGNTTGVVLSYTYSGAFVLLQANSSTSGWTLKTIIRTI